MFVCHREMNHNPVLDALLGEGITLNLATQAPGVLTFTDPEQVRDILTAAGFRSEAASPFEFSSTIHGTASDAAAFLLNGNLRALVRGAGEVALSQARAALATALRPFADTEAVRPPAAGWLHTATRTT